MLSRRVRWIFPESKGQVRTTSFEAVLNQRNLILLGDPGAGKSFLFQHGSEREKSLLMAARQSQSNPINLGPGQGLYIDALDETRARSDGHNALGVIAQKLWQLEPHRFRLSCRSIDWLGNTDIQVLEPYFHEHDGLSVVALEDLTDSEIDKILDRPDAAIFRERAKARGVDSLLRNPQTLLLLSASVSESAPWPTTKTELFEVATKHVLTEHNENRSRLAAVAVGQTAIGEAAGAACATSLLAGTPGFAISETDSSDDFPLFSRVGDLCNLEALQAAMGSKLFEGVGTQRVRCVHRTLAEFLGAKWLGNRVRAGFPLRRLLTLIGQEGVPATELRGLYAWLAHVLLQRADELFPADPFGVLLYGDPASMPPAQKMRLLSALEQLARVDPWFRGYDWSSEPLGGLSGTEMAADIERILDTSDSQHLRSLVLDAVKNGPPVPELRPRMLTLMADESACFGDRSDAIDCLIAAIPGGTAFVEGWARSQLRGVGMDVRLVAHAICAVGAERFSSADVASLILATLNSKFRQPLGTLWQLSNSLPGESVPDILDEVCRTPRASSGHRRRRNETEVSTVLDRLAAGVVAVEEHLDPLRVWTWVQRISTVEDSWANPHLIQRTTSAIEQDTSLRREIQRAALLDCSRSKLGRRSWWSSAHLRILNYEDTCSVATGLLLNQDVGPSEESKNFVYEIALRAAFRTTSVIGFEALYAMSLFDNSLSSILKKECISPLENWRAKKAEIDRVRFQEKAEASTKQREFLANNTSAIRNATLQAWIRHIARVYWSLYDDIDRELSPSKRLEDQFGASGASIAMEGLKAAFRQWVFPTPNEAAALATRNQGHRDMAVLLAGMDITWRQVPDLSQITDETLEALVGAASTAGIDVRALEWHRKLLEERPAFCATVFASMAEVGLNRNADHCPGLWDLCQLPGHGNLVVKLLGKFPHARPEHLASLIEKAIAVVQVGPILEVVKATLSGRPYPRLRRLQLWISAGVVLDCERFQKHARVYFRKRPESIWAFKTVVDAAYSAQRNDTRDFPIAPLLLGITVFGPLFPPVRLPDESVGNENAWDAARFIQSCIDRASTSTSRRTSGLLRECATSPRLDSYRDALLHAAASQSAVVRSTEFEPAELAAVLETLRGGKPAHVPDLHAVLVNKLQEAREQLRGNTDGYKAYWNEDSHARPLSPKVEDSCRDRLVEHLRPDLARIGVRVEPEGHMFDDKRADIVAFAVPGTKLVLELKRDVHRSVWTACADQLQRMYMRDPEAAGYGIYVVFWFGEADTRKLARHPSGLASPQTALEMEDALREQVATEYRHRLAIVVLDVSRPRAR